MVFFILVPSIDLCCFQPNCWALQQDPQLQSPTATVYRKQSVAICPVQQSWEENTSNSIPSQTNACKSFIHYKQHKLVPIFLTDLRVCKLNVSSFPCVGCPPKEDEEANAIDPPCLSLECPMLLLSPTQSNYTSRRLHY